MLSSPIFTRPFIDCLTLQTPLHLAVILNSDDIVSLLISAKADVCKRDRHGRNVIHLAINYHSIEALSIISTMAPSTLVQALRDYDYEGIPLKI